MRGTISRLAVLAACLVATSAPVCAIELDWIPVDGEGPLPLSAAFREKLGRLCELIESGAALPPQIEARLKDIQKMCAKLHGTYRAPRGIVKWGVATVAGGVLGGWAWHSWQTKGLVYKLIQEQKRAKKRAALAARRRAVSYGFTGNAASLAKRLAGDHHRSSPSLR